MRLIRKSSSRALWILGVTLMFTGALAFSSQKTAAEDDSPSQTEQGYLLQFKFVPGQEVSYKVTYEMAHTTRKGQVAETAFNSSTTMKHYRVSEVEENGYATLLSYIDSVKMEVRFNQGEPLVYDSNSDEVTLPQFRKIKSSIGIPLAKTTFDPTGNVIRLVNLNEEKKPASDSTQEETAEKTEKSPETEQASNANDKEIKTVAASTEPAQEEDKDDLNAVGNYLVNFPKNRVKIDERWAQTYSVPVAVDRKLQQDVRLKREYRLRSVENGIASITFKTSVLSSIHNPMIAAQLIQNTPSGTIEFDLERGLIVKRTAELDNTEFGFSGENSSMRAVSKTVETLVNSEIKPETEPAE